MERKLIDHDLRKSYRIVINKGLENTPDKIKSYNHQLLVILTMDMTTISNLFGCHILIGITHLTLK